MGKVSFETKLQRFQVHPDRHANYSFITLRSAGETA